MWRVAIPDSGAGMTWRLFYVYHFQYNAKGERHKGERGKTMQIVIKDPEFLIAFMSKLTKDRAVYVLDDWEN
jgi:hypothetical protein